MNTFPYTEPELKREFFALVATDFEVQQEARGIHMVENVTVFADALLYPKQHLIARGFDPEYIAVEIKAPNGNSGRVSQALWQAASYGQSLFANRRPMFSILYPDIAVFEEYNNHHLEPEINSIIRGAKVGTLRHIAQYMNVGFIEFLAHGAWNIKIGGQRYFSTKDGKGKANLLKRYVGTKQ